ncbi:hypothetical protein TSAR_007313, partial [Trichomalopsis sarcophagae]
TSLIPSPIFSHVPPLNYPCDSTTRPYKTYRQNDLSSFCNLHLLELHQIVGALTSTFSVNSKRTYILAKRKMDSKKRVEEDFHAYRRVILSPHSRLDTLRNTYEFTLSPDKEVAILCGERFHEIPEKSEFMLRLMCVKEDIGQVASIEFSMETILMLKSHMEATCRVLDACDEGLILQNAEVQVYAMADSRGGDFLVHFEDRNRVKISLDINEIKMWMYKYINIIDRFYKVFTRKTIAKRKRLEKAMQSTIEDKLIGLLQPRKRRYVCYAEPFHI